MNNPIRAVVLALLRVYQLAVSPLLPACCRFTPTCSEYTRTAVTRFGVVRGLWLGLRRLCRCHPFHPGGADPVPAKTEADNTGAAAEAPLNDLQERLA